MKFAVYGEGHLADTHRAALDLRGLLYKDGRNPQLAFVAEDVVSHSDERALAQVDRLVMAAFSVHGIVVVVSQVPPGWIRAAAGSRVAKLFYQVDTIIVARAVERVLRPEQVVVGCADPSAPLPLEYQTYLALHDCPVLQMSYESAELAKCMINVALARQIALANDGALVAEKVGADWGDVARALSSDARIGPRAYLRPGKLNQHLLRDLNTFHSLLDRSRKGCA